MIDISFVIPCYNEAGNVRLIHDRIHKVFDPEGIRTQIIMINDGSRDGTGKELRALHGENPGEALTVVNFSRNFGKEAAMMCGLSHATGNSVCFIDADMQQRPEVALEMYKKLISDDEIDCVAAYQAERNEGKVLTFFKDCFYSLINKMTSTPFRPGASDFRVMTRQMADEVRNLKEYFRFSKGLFSWVGFNTFFMPYTVCERNSGKSSWNFMKLFRYAIEGIVGYSTVPLRFSTWFGAGLSLASLIELITCLVLAIVKVPVSAALPVIGCVFLACGIQCIMLGIIGEYLARDYMQGKNRPVYIEKEVLEGSANGIS